MGKIEPGVTRFRALRLRAGKRPWSFAEAHAAAIDAHWQAETARNPAYFNGRVFLLVQADVSDGCLEGEVLAVDFKAFLYWRTYPHLEPTTIDAFGSAVVLSRDGACLLAVPSAGQLNSGLAYPPSGLIDLDDETANGRVDVEATAERELAEETGLIAADMVREPGILATYAWPLLSLAVVYRSDRDCADLDGRIRRHIAADATPELERAVWITRVSDLDRVPSLPYVAVLARALLPA
jgi:8-oxo-dGTP pyrophosphatase MutT (NUDIX family)